MVLYLDKMTSARSGDGSQSVTRLIQRNGGRDLTLLFMSRSNGSQPSGIPNPYSAIGAWKKANEPNSRVDDAATNRGARLQAKLGGGAHRQSISDRFPSRQDVRPERGKLVLHDRVQSDLRHERAVPAVPWHVGALAREGAEGARASTCRAVREVIGEIEELAAFEAVGRHEALQPEDLRDLHLKLNKRKKEGCVCVCV